MIVIAAAMLLAGAEAGAAEIQSQPLEWTVIDHGERLMALELSGVREIGERRRGWWMLVNRATDARGVDYMMTNFEIDCLEESLRIRSIAEYDMTGRSVGQQSYSSAANPIIPGSAAYRIHGIVCLGTPLDGSVAAPSDQFAQAARTVLNEDAESSDRP